MHIKSGNGLLRIGFLFYCSTIIVLACNKNENHSNSPIYPTTDSLPMPLKIGNWWKYKRIDSSYFKNPFGPPYATDSSVEVITVIGTKKIADSVISSILEVKNLTYSQTDTIYAFYFRSDFIITKYPNNIYAYADNKYLNQYDMRFRLPPAEGKYFISTNSLLARTDSICIKKDSTAQIINNSFAACLYTSEYEYDFQGANAYSYFSKSLLKNNVGLVYWYAEYYSASHYGSSSDSWFIRRILDYAVQP